MKRILSIFMIAATLLTLLVFAGCDEGTAKELKLGLGIYTEASAIDATEDKNGTGEAAITVAAVLVDEEGKIVKAFVDCADNSVNYTSDGKALAKESFATKYELGDAYNMVAYGGASSEWYEQADKFCALIVGKTTDEIAALVAEDNKGTEEVINAGCTIYISEFVKAVEKAVANAVATKASANDTLKLGISTTQTCEDATEDKIGSNAIETTIFAAAVDADGKIVDATSDCVEVSFSFDIAGATSFDAEDATLTKREKGDSYGMKTYAGSAKEWYEQADAFDAACEGKTASEISGLMNEEYKAVDDLQAAGCTIYISEFVKAATKIA